MYFSYKGFLFKELSFELLFIPSPTKLRRDIVTLPSVRPSHPCEHSRINILQWILIKLGTYLVLKRIWNPIDFQRQRSRSQGQICTVQHPCEHSRINTLQWILTKLGTYLVLKRIWNTIDFQGHMSKIKVTGSNVHRITSLWTLESTSFNCFFDKTWYILSP